MGSDDVDAEYPFTRGSKRRAMADGEGEKQVKKKGWQPKRADWRAGGGEVCLRVVSSFCASQCRR